MALNREIQNANDRDVSGLDHCRKRVPRSCGLLESCYERCLLFSRTAKDQGYE
jgi:hypothetical protein